VIQVSEQRRRGLALFLFVFLGMAPTVGDIGSCEQAPDALDPRTFFALKAHTECTHCRECALTTNRCDNTCDVNVPTQTSFSPGCEPLVHDGEVCLRVLLHASCDDYASFMSDTAATAPSECQFCALP
jgi:hypothetical protein